MNETQEQLIRKLYTSDLQMVKITSLKQLVYRASRGDHIRVALD